MHKAYLYADTILSNLLSLETFRSFLCALLSSSWKHSCSWKRKPAKRNQRKDRHATIARQRKRDGLKWKHSHRQETLISVWDFCISVCSRLRRPLGRSCLKCKWLNHEICSLLAAVDTNCNRFIAGSVCKSTFFVSSGTSLRTFS